MQRWGAWRKRERESTRERERERQSVKVRLMHGWLEGRLDR